MKQFSLSCLIDLPDDPFAAAELTAKLKTPWYAMLEDLKRSGVAHVHKQECVETRTKPASTGVRRWRKPRVTTAEPAPATEA